MRLRNCVPRRLSAFRTSVLPVDRVVLHATARSVKRLSVAIWIVAAVGTAACAVVASRAVASATTSTTSLTGAGLSGNARPLRTGFLDPTAFRGPSADRSVLRAQRAGATLVRVLVAWKGVAPARPADPEDPEDPAYHWHFIDQQVVDAVRGGLDPLVYISASAPWASGAAVGLPGTWPSPARFADFARATALRYSGTFTPTGATVPLPRVRFWQAWNEPNAGRELAPQRAGGRAVSPTQYRRMVNAFADAVHGVNASNLVVAGGLGPFGHDSKDIQVVAPMEFMGTLLCVSLQAPHRKTCSAAHPFRRVGAPPVLERRSELARAWCQRRVHRRPPGDASIARCGGASRHDHLGTGAEVLGHGVQLGHKSA